MKDTTMFPRSAPVKSGDKKIRYWKPVQNYHMERGTRQRVVAHLGGLENFTAEDWRRLAIIGAIKEKGVHDRLLGRMRKDIESLAARVEGGKLKVSTKIERAAEH